MPIDKNRFQIRNIHRKRSKLKNKKGPIIYIYKFVHEIPHFILISSTLNIHTISHFQCWKIQATLSRRTVFSEKLYFIPYYSTLFIPQNGVSSWLISVIYRLLILLVSCCENFKARIIFWPISNFRALGPIIKLFFYLEPYGALNCS